MCGICGLRLGDPQARVSPDLLGAMTATMVHRGPDGEGQRVLGRVGLGHRRLSIIDLSDVAAQPMANEDETVWVSYNGEIYNFPALREELLAAGHRFRTHCDTEVLVHGFEEWGTGLLERLSGMFAFALYDTRADRLLLARDRMGIKPLYYAWAGPDLVFGSELRALFASGRVSRSVEASLVDAFVSLGYVPGDRTLFAGVRKLRPGHLMLVEEGGVRIEPYWDLTQTPADDRDFEAAKAGLKERLVASVESHLISDVPLGVFLSGGVDSSAVVALLRRELGRSVSTFSVGYADDPASSELGYAGTVAKLYETDHHEFVLTHEDFFQSVERLLEHTEEPLVESAAVALMQLSHFTKPHATVLLSGEGADEVFAGYDLYGRNFQIEKLRRVAFPLRFKLFRNLLYPFLRSERLRKYLDWVGSTLEQRYRGISNDVTPSIRTAMYEPAFLERCGAFLDHHFGALFDQVGDREPLVRMQFADIQTWLVDDLLLKADKMTMAASIELRVPFLDHSVVEYGFGLSTAAKRRGGVGKAPLKSLLEDYLPREILYRPKQGFPVPVDKWFREDLHERVRGLLLDPRTLRRGYFRPEYLRRTLDRHREGAENLGRRLFSLLVLELWHRRYVD